MFKFNRMMVAGLLAVTVMASLIAQEAKALVPSGGRKVAYERVQAYSTDRYTQTFIGGYQAEVAVVGDGDTDLDLVVYDQYGNVVAYDTDYTDRCYVRFVPRYTGLYVIKVINRGHVYNDYGIAID